MEMRKLYRILWCYGPSSFIFCTKHAPNLSFWGNVGIFAYLSFRPARNKMFYFQISEITKGKCTWTLLTMFLFDCSLSSISAAPLQKLYWWLLWSEFLRGVYLCLKRTFFPFFLGGERGLEKGEKTSASSVRYLTSSDSLYPTVPQFFPSAIWNVWQTKGDQSGKYMQHIALHTWTISRLLLGLVQDAATNGAVGRRYMLFRMET